VLLFPEDPHECFTMAADSLDLAERLQTPVFLMTDLDIGMNHRLCEPLKWDDTRAYDRGKVMTREDLDTGRDFGRYLDADGDGIPYRTYPGTHPDKGAYFTRGTTRDAYARYSEAGPDYLYNVERLLRKFETAKDLVPQPVLRSAARATRFGVLYYGSTSPAMSEAFDSLRAQGVHVDLMRLRAFPFSAAVDQFIASHEHVFVIEQNRDAQLRTLLVTEQEVNPAKLEPVLHYDGTPITARFINDEIAARIKRFNVEPISKGKVA
jgi:2-oxoglutarate/2-oxoacid ferredoxin oxidoreductase subunit alpha